MKRWLALAIVALMLAVPPASAAPWGQPGYDAARTGDTADPGPGLNETAFTTRLPGDLYHQGDFPAFPVILDGSAYVAVVPSDTDDRDAQGIARVDLDTAETELFIETDAAPQAIATDGARLFVARDGGLDAYELSTGELAWSLPQPISTANHVVTVCFAPAVTDGRVYLPCNEYDGRWHPFVWGVNATAGETEVFQRLPLRGEDATGTGSPAAHLTLGVSIIGDHLLTITFAQQYQHTGQAPITGDEIPCDPPAPPDGCSRVQRTRISLLGLHAASGAIQWRNSTEVVDGRADGVPVDPFTEVREPLPSTSFHPTGEPGAAYVKFDGKFQQRNPGQDGKVVWQQALGTKDATAGISGTSSAFTNDAVYVASLQTVARYDVAGPTPVLDWQTPLDRDRGELMGVGSLTVADGVLYAMAFRGNETAFYAFEAATGEVRWRHEVHLTTEKADRPYSPFVWGMGDGVIVAAGEDGTVHVIGRTNASLEPAADVSSTTPEAGETVSVDLSGTTAGAFGQADRYRAVWGDGSVSPWQSDPVLTHTYTEEGNATARFQVANDADQTASIHRTFRVGYTEPNLVEEAFQQENQDLTFGILGLLVAVTGGAIGVARRYRERSRLQEELDALEAGFEDSRGNPGECEAFLETRKARARSLVVDGELTEEQFSVVESRIDELRGELRISMLDERFAFLPHGMVRTLERMLEDGRINAFERDALMQALDEQDMLSEEQKGKVERLIGQWSREGDSA